MIRYLLILLTITCTGVLTAQNQENNPVVLELFTSQGCSSCPPADELLDTIKETYKNKDVYVLSYHVDYWDRLGWRDPFSAKEYSDYQRDYAEQFNSRSIYTPQLVVNGSEHFTGSNRGKANLALHKYAKNTATHDIKLNILKKEREGIVIKYNVADTQFDRITFALVVSERVTKVGRGENRNRTLKNTNIVANRLVHRDTSGTAILSIPDWITADDELSVIAYTQNESLKTTGATKLAI